MTEDTPKNSRAGTIHQALRQAILEQALAPGAKLPEDLIASQFGVSRTLVREALGRLAGEGLVELRHNRGASVASPSLAEARDVFAIRRAMELLAVDALCGRLDAAQEARLQAHVDAEAAAQPMGDATSIRLAGEFHLLLAELTGNALLQRYVAELASRCSLILSLYGRPHSADCAVEEHRALIAALRDGDASACRALMEHHLDAVMGRALLPQRPGDMREVLARYAGTTSPSPPRRAKARSA
ncbi:GntR family transcriptional regulator [Pseudoroseomonas deserti]|uniref:GntR family transcriptional regulator n=1 Tax=Teichococcus deserti TaxID=1817963 RepID=A0A1V2H225_9PROT|nr:GntR family transcriptional regulator [Pseudoroseomonas deserti]ONG52319.1 GntR family transcriptional regulator [Pseudoroseomonas deserti]